VLRHWATWRSRAAVGTRFAVGAAHGPWSESRDEALELRAARRWDLDGEGRQWRPNLEREDACAGLGGVVAMCLVCVSASICADGRPPSRQAGGFALHPGRWLDSSHPPRRSGDLGAKPKLQHSAVVEALWSPISSASAGQSSLGWSRLSPRPASYPWLIARSRAGQSGAACADRKVGKSRAGDGRSEGCSSEKSRIPGPNMGRTRGSARKAPTRSTEGKPPTGENARLGPHGWPNLFSLLRVPVSLFDAQGASNRQ
jgi:hypothetical protein